MTSALPPSIRFGEPVSELLPTIRFGQPIPDLPADTVHAQVTVMSVAPAEMTFAMASPARLDAVVAPSTGCADMVGGEPWEIVRDYVVRKIEERWGRFPRNPVKEAAVFRSFIDRWGDQALRIAQVACEDFGCQWRSAPISINRFCRGSDPWFASVIAQRI